MSIQNTRKHQNNLVDEHQIGYEKVRPLAKPFWYCDKRLSYHVYLRYIDY